MKTVARGSILREEFSAMMSNEGPNRWDDREVLAQLLGVYHEEWPEEFGTPQNAIRWYIDALPAKRMSRSRVAQPDPGSQGCKWARRASRSQSTWID